MMNLRKCLDHLNMAAVNMIDDINIAKRLISLYNSAHSRNIDFDLSFNTVKKILNSKKCYFTGVALNTITADKNQLTFDRIDNERGYINNNVVACSKEFNEKKANLTISDIRLMVKGFEKKNLW